jgi:uncharacterized damage-inducible protein DinB
MGTIDSIGAEMSGFNQLVPVLEHNLWANTILFDFCGGLDDEVLDSNVDGCYGSIRETLRHIAHGEELYVAMLTSPRPDTLRSSWADVLPVPASTALAKSTGKALIRCAKEIPGNTILEGVRADSEEYRVPASFLFIQAINHATEHRTQIATILTQRGIQPPDLDGWVYLDEVLLPQGASE